MKPWPAGMRTSNWPRIPIESVAPPRPASTPLPSTQSARRRSTRTPEVAAALGCSPTARMRRPSAVRVNIQCIAKGNTNASQVSALWPKKMRGSCGAGGLTPAEPKSDSSRKAIKLSATRLSAIPLTT